MEVGTEISQKIRSAIKAKLIELGAYVDDELPDYIMVMVANKKTQEQMVSDLSLFLGKNTNIFAEWLHGLLSKLQTVSVENKKEKSGKVKKKSDSKKEKKAKGKTKTKKTKSKDGSAPEGKKSTPLSNESEYAADKNDTELIDSTAPKSKDLDQEGATLANEEINNSSSATIDNNVSDEKGEVEDVGQMLVTETTTDELAAELETEENLLENEQLSTKSKQSADDKTTVISTNVSRKRSISPISSIRTSSSASKKHKSLTSVVASVNKDSEEEYDPLCPAVGSVASVVKVTERKSKVPPSLQANSTFSDGDSQMEEERQETDAECSAAKTHENVEDQDVTIDTDDVRQDGPEMEKCDSNENVTDLQSGYVQNEIVQRNDNDSSLVRLDQTASLDHLKIVFTDILNKWREESRDDIESFCQSMGSCLRKMNQRNLAIAKLRIQKILFDYESAIQPNALENALVRSNSNQSSSLSNSAVPQIEQQNIASTDISTNQNANDPESTISHSVSDKEQSTQAASNSQPEVGASTTPSSSSLQKPDSCASPISNDQHQPGSSNPSQSVAHQTTLSPNGKPQKHKHHSPVVSQINSFSLESQTISVDSLHLKHKQQSSESGSKGSVLRFRSSQPSSSASKDTDGTDSPDLMSAEQLQSLAKNLKITISNSNAKSSNSEEEESSSSDDSDDDDESDSDEEDDSEKEEVQNKLKIDKDDEENEDLMRAMTTDRKREQNRSRSRDDGDLVKSRVEREFDRKNRIERENFRNNSGDREMFRRDRDEREFVRNSSGEREMVRKGRDEREMFRNRDRERDFPRMNRGDREMFRNNRNDREQRDMLRNREERELIRNDRIARQLIRMGATNELRRGAFGDKRVERRRCDSNSGRTGYDST